jgi:hypothetical protein
MPHIEPPTASARLHNKEKKGNQDLERQPLIRTRSDPSLLEELQVYVIGSHTAPREEEIT